MSTHQAQAIWELCREGFPLVAQEAEDRWECGRTYRPDGHLPLSRRVSNLIDQCNWEISHGLPAAGAVVAAHAAVMRR